MVVTDVQGNCVVDTSSSWSTVSNDTAKVTLMAVITSKITKGYRYNESVPNKQATQYRLID